MLDMCSGRVVSVGPEMTTKNLHNDGIMKFSSDMNRHGVEVQDEEWNGNNALWPSMWKISDDLENKGIQDLILHNFRWPRK